MIASVGMILIALVFVSLYFKGVAADAAAGRRVVIAALAASNVKLDEATAAIDSLNALVQDRDGSRARALSAAVKQVTDAQAKVINELFVKERAISKAEADRQLTAIRSAQAELEKRIAAILAGPPGPPGQPGPPGPKGNCQLVCL